jgi:hypothetical protein
LDRPIAWESLVAKLEGLSAAMVVMAAQDVARAAVLEGKSFSQDKLLQAVEEQQRHDAARRA